MNCILLAETERNKTYSDLGNFTRSFKFQALQTIENLEGTSFLFVMPTGFISIFSVLGLLRSSRVFFLN
jgi:hypothetical protein